MEQAVKAISYLTTTQELARIYLDVSGTDRHMQIMSSRSGKRRLSASIFDVSGGLTDSRARSTSAAIGFFKPYKRKYYYILPPEFTDGGLFQNNPVQVALEESRSLAKSRNQGLTPDIILSVGTGLPREYLNNETPKNSAIEGPTTDRQSWYRVLFSVVSFQLKLNLDAEKRWREQLQAEPGIRDRMHRINPWLGVDPPAMDDRDCVPNLSKLVSHDLQNDENLRNQVVTTASALAASSFYFTASKILSERTGVMQLFGHIKCRLSGSESDIRGLGKFLSKCRSSFLVQSIPGYRKDMQVGIPVGAMVERGSFEDIDITIEVPGEDAQTIISLKLPGLVTTGQLYPISGFPRGLFRQDAALVSRRSHSQSRDNSIAHRGSLADSASIAERSSIAENSSIAEKNSIADSGVMMPIRDNEIQ